MAYSIVDFGKAAWNAAGELGDLFSAKKYDIFAKGRNDVPSVNTIQNHFGSFNEWKATYGLETLDGGPPERSDVHLRTNGQGYEYITIKDETGTHEFPLHRLVATLTVDDPVRDMAGKHVHHRNEVTWYNAEDNLEVLSPSEHRRIHSLPEEQRA